jgi:hypothetical protein
MQESRQLPFSSCVETLGGDDFGVQLREGVDPDDTALALTQIEKDYAP